MENIFSLLKKNMLALHSEMFDIFHKAVDIMGKLLASSEGEDISGIIQELELLKTEETGKKRDVLTEKIDADKVESFKEPLKEIPPQTSGIIYRL
jgi:chemotaxis protein histidine kinase CheA